MSEQRTNALGLVTVVLLLGCKDDTVHCQDPSAKCASEPTASASPGPPISNDCAGASAAELGQPAPGLCVVPVTGEGPTSLSGTKGQVTVVDFWATFCEPCRKSFPKYQQMVDKGAGSLVVIAVSVDDPEERDEADIEKFASETGVSFSIVWDRDHKTADIYNPDKMPTSYVIDKEGVLRHVHAGYTAEEASVIEREVEALSK